MPTFLLAALDPVWSFLSPVLSALLMERGKRIMGEEPRDQSLTDAAYTLYQTVSDVRDQTHTYVVALHALANAIETEQPSRDFVRARQEMAATAKDLSRGLADLAAAVSAVNPDLSVHSYDLVMALGEFRSARSAVIRESLLVEAAYSIGEEDKEAVRGLVERAEQNERNIDQALEDLRTFLQTHFVFTRTRKD